jgi:hypothetical protein
MIGIGIGVDWSVKRAFTTVGGLIAAFRIRMAADSGVFEAEACLNATLTNLNNI